MVEGIGKESGGIGIGNVEKTFLREVYALLEELCIGVFELFGALLKG